MKKPLHERIAAKEAKIAREMAQLARMARKQKKADRDLDTRRKVLVGAVVLGEMERTPQFAKFVRAMLDKAITRPHDRAAIAYLFQSAAETVTPASNANIAPTPPSSPSSSTPSLSGPSYAVTVREKAAG